MTKRKAPDKKKVELKRKAPDKKKVELKRKAPDKKKVELKPKPKTKAKAVKESERLAAVAFLEPGDLGLTERQQLALEMFAHGVPVPRIAATLDINQNTIYTWASMKAGKLAVSRFRRQLRAKMREILQDAQIRAALRMDDLLTSDNEVVAFQASKWMLEAPLLEEANTVVAQPTQRVQITASSLTEEIRKRLAKGGKPK